MPLTDQLGGAWRLDNDFADASGNGRVPAGGFFIAFTTDPTYVVQGTHALLSSFDQSVIWGGPAATLADTSLTLSSWMTRAHAITAGSSPVGWDGVLKFLHSDTVISGLGIFVGTTKVRAGVTDDLPFAEKHHWALTWDHTTGAWELWKDGVSFASGTLGGQTADIAACSFIIDAGPTSPGDRRNPQDMVCAWTRKLTPAEIATIANPSNPDPTNQPVYIPGEWPQVKAPRQVRSVKASSSVARSIKAPRQTRSIRDPKLGQ